MRKQNNILKSVLSACCLLVIILDGKTAFSAMKDGIELCLQTVIPALFPFFILSGLIGSCLLGVKSKLLGSVNRLCRIPRGSESILLVGFLSGYPIGALLVTQAYQMGTLNRSDARRMLGFCSYAGPSFIFGMLLPLFGDQKILFVLWAIHIASGILVGWLLPGGQDFQCVIPKALPITISQALKKAVENIALVCGWIMIFRVILEFCKRWFLWLFPMEIQVLLSGFLELSNGCLFLENIPHIGTKFLLAGLMLSFGGLSVAMQTASVTGDLGLGLYFPGKILQTLFTLTLSSVLQSYIFPSVQPQTTPILTCTLLGISLLTVIFLRGKKVVAFRKRLLYNTLR